ncbi:hypothetical protein VTG60DRAFT_3951 [Thermothelomyces hinnuleus]
MPSSQPPSSDRSLLDRLNALKPTSITFDKSANPASATGPGTQPESKEDALTARLRILRSQTSGEKPGEGAPQTQVRSQQPGRPDAVRDGAGTAASPLVDQAGTQPSSISPKGHRSPRQSRFSYQIADSQVDDEEAVDELLEALADEDFELATAEDAEPAPRQSRDDEAERVSDLLRSRQHDAGASTPQGSNPPSGDDSDDSDGEQMTRAVETVLSQIRDEIRSLPPPGATLAKQDDNQPAEDGQQRSGEDESAEAERGAGLQAPAGGAADRPGDRDEDGDGDGDEPSFTLPAVPSQLPDPATTTTATTTTATTMATDGGGDDFEKDISARLASLRGFGSLDALGLPSAPTFRPQDRHGQSSSVPVGKNLLRPSRYTDEDQKTWCIVCLEDAAIRCIGCDNDVYCARCWKEMHVGPSAGYDERGHQWVKFERNAPR